ncbi:hypothetical protein EN750_01925 [Mesorhizobium sp. M7A.F.Ca.ET.027.03.2.1]|nr:hypothetical protein EN750_01925 [Mesorhizobium sp. M7A.F.Ca.ET.027.03.2.1]
MRRHLLEDLIVARGSDGVIVLSEEVEADGSQLLEHACQVGLEGICIQSESFMIVGFELSATARGGVGSLLLAGKCGNDWAYAGAVGTAFDSKEAASLRSTLDQLSTNKPAVP